MLLLYTLFLSNDIDFKTKKNDKKLENKLEVTKSSDIELNGGFIFIKNSNLDMPTNSIITIIIRLR